MGQKATFDRHENLVRANAMELISARILAPKEQIFF